jgi:hypothetical protein
MDTNKFYLEAKKVFPREILKKTVRNFLKTNQGAPDHTLLAQWEALKADHITYWRDRYGLDDVRPYKMLPGKLIMKFSWNILDGALGYIADIVNQQTLRGYYPFSSSDPYQIVFDTGAILSQKTKGVWHVKSIESPKGSVSVYSNWSPQWDWVIWKQQQFEKYHGKVSKNYITQVVTRYKNDIHAFSDLHDLEKHIQQYAHAN